MKKAAIAIATLVAALGLFQLLAGPDAGAAPLPGRTPTDLTFTEGVCGDPGSFCKTTGKPVAFGTRLVFRIPLTTDGTKIGYEEGECVNLTKNSHSNYCTYNLHLADGTLALQGTLPYDTDAGGTIPVIGGTGAYLGAYGTLTFLDAGSFDYGLQVMTP